MERELLRTFLRDMLLARRFEERAAQEYTQGNIAGFLHLYPGEEAVAVGVIRAADAGDYIVSTYREHVHALVRGIPPKAVMAELFGRVTGVCKGMGGSMHLFDRERRFMGGYAIVGETYPVAIGAGYAIAMRRTRDVAVCFFGDGAVNQGTFHESLNMAALWKLPVLFVCENNRYQIGTEIHRHSAVADVYARACAYGIPAEQVDGMDVLKVFEATRRALALIREGTGPYLIECLTYRYRGHSMADAGAYRPPVELKAFQARDPLATLEREMEVYFPTQEEIAACGPDCIETLAAHCRSQGILDEEALKALEEEVAKEVEEAVAFAAQSPEPTMEEAFDCMERAHRHEVLL